MPEMLRERLIKTPEGYRLYQQERAILEATELICKIMDDAGVSRSQLAERLGKSKGYVTQLLDGHANMTIRTLSDVFTALSRTLHLSDEGQDALQRQPIQVALVVFAADIGSYGEPPRWPTSLALAPPDSRRTLMPVLE